MKRQATDWAKIFARHISEKGRVSKIYKEFLKLNSKWTNNSVKNGQKIWTGTSLKKVYRWQISIWKDAPHHMLLENHKLKQWDIIKHLLEWPKSKTVATPNPGEDVERQELSFSAGGNEKLYSFSEDSLVVSYKAKHTLTVQSSNCPPWYLPKWVENICPPKSL